MILLCHGYVCRHTHRSFTEFSLVSNKVLLWSVLGGIGLLFPILYVPVIAHDIFKHNAISWEWAVCFVCLGLFLLGTELYKLIKRKYKVSPMSSIFSVLILMPTHMRYYHVYPYPTDRF